jgi:hypothetical protein
MVVTDNIADILDHDDNAAPTARRRVVSCTAMLARRAAGPLDLRTRDISSSDWPRKLALGPSP